MRKFVSLVLFLAIVASLCGCGTGEKNTTKFAYELKYPTHSMFYMFDTNTKIVESIYYGNNTIYMYNSGTYTGDPSTGASVLFTGYDGTSWNEYFEYGSSNGVLYVSIGDDPTKVSYN